MPSWKELFWISGSNEEAEEAQLPKAPAPVPTPVLPEPTAFVERLLESLDDVEGVVGSFALAPDGALLGKSPGREFDPSTLTRLGGRIAQLLAALNSDGNGSNAPKGGVLRFQDRQLYLNPIRIGVVGVLAEQRINVPALTMALRLVAQQLDGRASVMPITR